MSSFNERFTRATELPPITVEAPEDQGQTVPSNPTRLYVGRSPISAPPKDDDRLNTGKEIMTLEVRGSLFTNWTSVRIEQLVTKPFPTFQFECSEEADIPLRWDALQFVPGDICRAYVGGVPAVFGYIVERHVGLDAKNHGVRLIGCGDTVDLTNSSVPIEKLDGHDGKSWSALATDLMAHLGIKLKKQGAVDDAPFEKIQIQPGERIMDALERYARMRNIVIGSDANGGLLAIGENSASPSGDLIEGVNILRVNAVLRDQMVYKKIYVIGQSNGSNQAYGDGQNKQIATEDGTSSRNRMQVIPAELADDMHGIKRRAMMEKVFTEGSFIEAQVTVQGWFKNNNQSDDVWKAGEYYTVTSPMLIMNGMVLGCAGCVYEQTDQGSITTLSLVDPIHMNGQLNYRDAVQKTLQAERERVLAEKAKGAK
ncbi:prophage tail gpP-like protein [Bradyrhizobium sp. S3.9.2]|uniref:phage baseplate assembly protein n=1 Tax=unclassified Bradyrhizobium TaxID=2631580 RepID=UPI0033933497